MNKRYIGQGNNLGNKNSSLNEEERTDLYYDSDIISIIDRDWTIKLAIVRSLGLEPHLQKNPQYIEWCNSAEADDASAKDFFEKRLEYSNGQYDDLINSAINELKSKYASMFSTIDNLYQQANNNGNPNKLDIVEGYADLGQKVFLEHRIPLPETRESLDNRRELGIIASEWFGAFEKFGECRFCSSFTGFVGNQDLSASQGEKSISFIIDTQSEELQKLLHLDYFRFQRCRKEGDLSAYTEYEIDFLTQLDEWSNHNNASDSTLQQLNGKGGEDVAFEHPNWIAVPGGVPSKYITGIMLHGIGPQELSVELKDALKQFDCPILDESYSVIYAPNNQNIKDEEMENN